MIRSYSTLAGARRATEGNRPIIRLLDDPRHLFIPLPGDAMIYALDPRTGRTDGMIKVLDLMAGGPSGSPGGDMRQGVDAGTHAALDALERWRGIWDREGRIGRRLARGSLDDKRGDLVLRAARALYEIGLIDAEIGEERERDREA